VRRATGGHALLAAPARLRGFRLLGAVPAVACAAAPGFWALLREGPPERPPFAYDGSKFLARLPPAGFLFLGIRGFPGLYSGTWQSCRARWRSTLRTRNYGDRGRSHTVTIRGQTPRNRPLDSQTHPRPTARCPEPTPPRYRTPAVNTPTRGIRSAET
jgi:hypothetical protein